MEINLPLSADIQATLSKVADGGLKLKLNQVLDAKVVDTQIMLDTLTVKINNKTVNLHPQSPLTLQADQTLKLQVVKLLPSPEFKIIATLLPNPDTPQQPQTASMPLLKLLNVVPAPTNPPLNQSQNQLTQDQPLQATVINLTGDKLTLQLQPAAATPNQQPVQLTLNTAQIVTTDRHIATADTQRNPATLKPGMPVTLQVLDTGDSPKFSLTPAKLSNEQPIVDALRQLLPIQSSPTPLLNQLQQVMPRLQADASVAETLKQLAREIVLNIPSKSQLNDPGELKRAVDQSGLFLEAKLLEILAGKSDLSLQDDFKLKLNKLIQQLNQELAGQTHDKTKDILELLKDSLQKAQGAQAKLTLDQLNSLPREESPKQAWSLELPFFHDQSADSVRIEIEQDQPGGSENQQQNWAVSITVTPPGLATIHCKITCYDGSVNTRFWSEAADTVDKINGHLDYLKQQFEKNGLIAGFMEAHQGQPKQTDGIKTPVANLLNEKV
ncbi:flagellar hook-length control protein FliK [Methylomonas methanica]|uniref:Flagellar hook-length control protein-like C-terminal domain-containing protein n=1 Tax=Methylomonas methanica (strain DSM 25384 / MC09) TaxID=857087 RepID=F9ZXC6_METMM|nr:flagellar hook-length control protein FliK [Methylomonas methanica]AEF99736.1 hypothetical protein Metme_1310 [Methylomonas methanica MC09]